MKVVFLNPQQEMGGIQCLSAYLKRAGHRTALVNDPNLFDNPYVHFPLLTSVFDDSDHLLGALEAERPGLVALPVVTDDYAWALRWTGRIKAHLKVPVVLGNAHPTYFPEQVLRQEGVDFVVRGEGEQTLLALVEALEGRGAPGDIPGLAWREGDRVHVNPMRPLIADLDTLPFPDKDLYYEPMPYLDFGYTTMTGRGCPYRCTFCGNTSLRKLYRADGQGRRWVRRHSPEYVVREILWAKQRYGITHVRFNDEDFSYDRRWLRAFCALYRERVGVPYSAWVHPNTVDAEIARLLAESGCDTVEMGIQSGSERLRREVLHRETPDERIVAAMGALGAAGIRVKVDLILGLPSETRADLDASARLLHAGQPWNVFAFWLRYYPGSEILALAKERGLLTPEQIDGVALRHPAFGSSGPGAPAAGFWVPELPPSSVTRRYLNFLVLLPILPRCLRSFLLRHDLIRFFPCFLSAFVLSNLSQVAHPDPTGEFRVRGRRMIFTEVPRVLRRTLARAIARLKVGPRAAPPSAERASP